MSRTSFDRDDRVWPAHLAELDLEQDDFKDLQADDHYIERDTVLENDLLETTLEDYDDLLSIARDDYGYEQ
ncbi:MAG: hypothetical protein ACR2QH_05285 [Geminicoccaceae bacterium]